MDNSKSTNYTLPLKALGARPWNFQTVYDALKKCRGDRQATKDLCTAARQMTGELTKYFRDELDKIPLLNPDKRESLLSDVDNYIQRLFKWLQDGQDKEEGPCPIEHEGLTSMHTSLLNRLRDLQQSAETGQEKGGQGETDDIAIDDKELTILAELAEGKNKTYVQVEIEAATSIPRGTIKDKLQRLEGVGLIHRPLGKRKGYQITDKGREIAHRNE